MAGLLRDLAKVDHLDLRHKQRLLCITPSYVHDQRALVLADRLGKSLGSLIDDHVPPSLLA